jgi:2-dehydro-3-deoxygluconokinase
VGVSVGAEGAYLLHDGVLHHEAAMPVYVVDRIGAGDGLAAGLLHGWLGEDIVRGLRYGVVLAALAASQYGDMIVTTAAEVEELTNAQESASAHAIKR